MCGVTSQVFALLLSILKPCSYRSYELRAEDKLTLFLMKLKLGISFNALACLFSVHKSTSRKIFHLTLQKLCALTKHWVAWLPKNIVQETLPKDFKDNYANCRAIIDCFEMKTEKPSSIEQQVHMYSHYKGGYTAKYLIAVAPNGYTMFISKGFGGKTTDSDITVQSGFLSLLEPGDVILADRGFPQIRSECENGGAILVMPPFSEGPGQFSSEMMDDTLKIATVRIHVERVINRVKFHDILNKRIHTDLLPYLDSIIHTCCVLSIYFHVITCRLNPHLGNTSPSHFSLALAPKHLHHIVYVASRLEAQPFLQSRGSKVTLYTFHGLKAAAQKDWHDSISHGQTLSVCKGKPGSVCRLRR